MNDIEINGMCMATRSSWSKGLLELDMAMFQVSNSSLKELNFF
jgi:hypothetical protein